MTISTVPVVSGCFGDKSAYTSRKLFEKYEAHMKEYVRATRTRCIMPIIMCHDASHLSWIPNVALHFPMMLICVSQFQMLRVPHAYFYVSNAVEMLAATNQEFQQSGKRASVWQDISLLSLSISEKIQTYPNVYLVQFLSQVSNVYLVCSNKLLRWVANDCWVARLCRFVQCQRKMIYAQDLRAVVSCYFQVPKSSKLFVSIQRLFCLFARAA